MKNHLVFSFILIITFFQNGICQNSKSFGLIVGVEDINFGHESKTYYGLGQQDIQIILPEYSDRQSTLSFSYSQLLSSDYELEGLLTFIGFNKKKEFKIISGNTSQTLIGKTNLWRFSIGLSRIMRFNDWFAISPNIRIGISNGVETSHLDILDVLENKSPIEDAYYRSSFGNISTALKFVVQKDELKFIISPQLNMSLLQEDTKINPGFTLGFFRSFSIEEDEFISEY